MLKIIVNFIKGLFVKKETWCEGSCIITTPVKAAVPIVLPPVVPADLTTYSNKKIRTMLQDVTGASDVQMKKIIMAMSLIEQSFNSDEFKHFVLTTKFTYTNKNNLDIYDTIIAGRQSLEDSNDYEADFYIGVLVNKNPFSKVIGYTNPQTKWQYVYTKPLNNFRASDLAGHLAHEYCHKVGFDHSSASDSKSVPYAVGYKVTELASKYTL